MTNSVSPHIIREYKLITSYPICEYGLLPLRWEMNGGRLSGFDARSIYKTT